MIIILLSVLLFAQAYSQQGCQESFFPEKQKIRMILKTAKRDWFKGNHGQALWAFKETLQLSKSIDPYAHLTTLFYLGLIYTHAHPSITFPEHDPIFVTHIAEGWNYMYQAKNHLRFDTNNAITGPVFYELGKIKLYYNHVPIVAQEQNSALSLFYMALDKAPSNSPLYAKINYEIGHYYSCLNQNDPINNYFKEKHLNQAASSGELVDPAIHTKALFRLAEETYFQNLITSENQSYYAKWYLFNILKCPSEDPETLIQKQRAISFFSLISEWEQKEKSE